MPLETVRTKNCFDCLVILRSFWRRTYIPVKGRANIDKSEYGKRGTSVSRLNNTIYRTTQIYPTAVTKNENDMRDLKMVVFI